jgi:hypothetical protein
MTGKISLKSIEFTGADTEPGSLFFGGGPCFVYGASNTGKSFVLKAINFLLGAAAKELPNIDESEPYDRAWLALNLPKTGDAVLERSTKGGAITLHTHAGARPGNSTARTLGAAHADDDPDTLSLFLLNELGIGRKRVAKNSSGQTISFSFRHLIRYSIVDETSIQATQSPISGTRADIALDRSIFRLLVTGKDDSAVQAKLTPPQFRVSKLARLATMDDLIADIEREISATETALGALPQATAEAEFDLIRQEVEAGRESIRGLVSARTDLASSISGDTARLNEVAAHVGRFHELERLYTSDIERLEAIEEAGFLLNLGGEHNCPLCGASPTNQHASHGTATIEAMRNAALVEITKIKALRIGLQPTIEDLSVERRAIEVRVAGCTKQLEEIETGMSRLSAVIGNRESVLRGALARRDLEQKLLRLREQRANFIERRDDYQAQKQSKKEKIDLSTPDKPIHELCQNISSILTQWQFPGNRRVSFDAGADDLRIDGKLRTDNGKGVRALTHTAFKLGVMQFCLERNLPHPGFLVLDSPLLTYRDVVRQPRHGALTADEQAVAQTPVRERFFEHLAGLKELGQIIVFDNIDPPSTVSLFATPVLFTRNPDEGRYGFFPVKRP